MIVFTFFVSNKDSKERFFEESFLLANVNLDKIFRMPFLTMSNTDVDFQARNLQWKSYNTRDILLTTKQVELIEKKEFAASTLDLEYKAFIRHVAAFNIDLNNEIHPLKRIQIAYLKVDEVPTKVFSEYADFIDIFSPKLAVELPEHTKINDHAIELMDD